MRKTIILILILCALLTVGASAIDITTVQMTQAERDEAAGYLTYYAAGDLRPVLGRVIDLPEGEDTITIQDTAGNIWMHEGREDWQIGDGVILLVCKYDPIPAPYGGYIVSATYIDYGNESSSGSAVIPLTEAETRDWAEKRLSADDYIAVFGEPEE